MSSFDTLILFSPLKIFHSMMEFIFTGSFDRCPASIKRSGSNKNPAELAGFLFGAFLTPFLPLFLRQPLRPDRRALHGGSRSRFQLG